MPIEKDYALYTYNDERDGQIGVGTVTSPWFDVSGTSEIMLMGNFAGNTTAVTVEQSTDGVGVDLVSADQLANLGTGAKLNVSYPYARVKIVQSAGSTTNAELSVKASD